MPCTSMTITCLLDVKHLIQPYGAFIYHLALVAVLHELGYLLQLYRYMCTQIRINRHELAMRENLFVELNRVLMQSKNVIGECIN